MRAAMSSPELLDVLAAARAPIPEHERERVTEVAHMITVLALVAGLEHPEDERNVARAARTFARGADAHRMGALVEPLAPAHGHAVIEALTRHGYVRPEQARIAHARIDAVGGRAGMRDNARSANDEGAAPLQRPAP
jgi:hypothetical protein